VTIRGLSVTVVVGMLVGLVIDESLYCASGCCSERKGFVGLVLLLLSSVETMEITDTEQWGYEK